MIHSVAHIYGQHLAVSGIVTFPAPGIDWPFFVNQMPENPHKVVVLYVTRGKMDGRIMRGGQMVTHPGLQVAVRAEDDPTAFAKISEIMSAMDALRQQPVTVDDVVYNIEAITRTSDAIALGEERGTTRRLYTTNAIFTLGVST